jgi:hypothetical protein
MITSIAEQPRFSFCSATLRGPRPCPDYARDGGEHLCGCNRYAHPQEHECSCTFRWPK